jgi:hypothetical protein
MSYEDLKLIEAFQFAQTVTQAKQGKPGFAEALAVAEVQDAMLRSWDGGGWETVRKITLEEV